MSEFDGLARAGGKADNTGLSNSLKSGGIPTANVLQWRSARPNPKGQIKKSDQRSDAKGTVTHWTDHRTLGRPTRARLRAEGSELRPNVLKVGSLSSEVRLMIYSSKGAAQRVFQTGC
ncbi:hypothetical protein [Yoonia sp. R2-816]|uniref:hypothetical protein n=1 Tax=Yoonia sp. R2-816 TaxID=3342638 RepID=UPI00372CA5E5